MQLRLLLWKNFVLKKRRPIAFLVEALLPLLLFLLLAWARTRSLPITVNAEYMNTYALPSAGVVSFAQSYLCGGLPSNISQSSLLQQAAVILERQNITLTNIVAIIDNVAIAELALNATLAPFGVSVNTLLDSLGLPIIPVSILTNLSSQVGGSSGRMSPQGSTSARVPFASALVMDQETLRTSIDATCAALKTVPLSSLEVLVAALGSIPANGQLDTNSTLDALVTVLRSQPTFLQAFVPGFFEALNASAPGTLLANVTNVTSISNATVQQIVAILNNQSLTNAQAQDEVVSVLQTQAGLDAATATAIGAGLFNFASTSTQNTGNSTASGNSTSTANSTSVESLTTALTQLVTAYRNLFDLSTAVNEISALPATALLRSALRNGTSVVNAIIDYAICPAGSSGPGFSLPSGLINRRRGAHPAADADADHDAHDHQSPLGSLFAGWPRARQLLGSGAAMLDNVWTYAFAAPLFGSSHVDPLDAARLHSEINAAFDRHDQSDGLDASAARHRRATTTSSFLQSLSTSKVYFAPNTSADVREVVRIANTTFDQLATALRAAACVSDILTNTTGDLETINLDFFRGYSDQESLVENAMGNERLLTVIGGIVFYSLSGPSKSLTPATRYAIRFNDLKVASTKVIQDAPTVTAGGSDNRVYYQYGFVELQDLFDRALIDFFADEAVPSPAGFVKQFPVPAYNKDLFALGITRTLPLLAVLAFIYSVSNIVKSVVYEKEMRLKEAMKMMGLSNWAHWAACGITSLVQLTITSVLLTIILVWGGIIKYTDTLLLFVFIELFVISTIAMSFAISVFFSKARLAAACAGIIYFVLYLPYIFISIRADFMTAPQKYLATLSSPAAFGLGCSYIAQNEVKQSKMTWSNMNQGTSPCDNFSFAAALGMLVVDIFFYGLLTWYIEAVFPGEYGIPRPWYFFLQASYWCGPSRDPKRRVDPRRPLPASQYCESAPDLPSGLSIRNLVKIYDDDAACLPCNKSTGRRAVDNLSLDAFEGQITGLLGHNGAGKTTTMSILVGLFPPTEGSVTVGSLDVVHHLDELRQHLGICPQYNVLFDQLTVVEHLWFCARLKGMTDEAAREEIDRFLVDVQLTEKADCYASTLSGGQKRKLSVALSFVGGAKLVVLDEPTAGVDPSARRAIWDLLLRYRKGRTLLLSTHHMDEADLLCDRIAIMAGGKLCCSGSSMFLKRAFGAGYTVTVSSAPDAPEALAPGTAMLTSAPARERARAITSVVLRHVPGAVLTDAAGQDLCFMLPATETARFEALFAELEASREPLGIANYGVSATTLEDVFLRVAANAEAHMFDQHEADDTDSEREGSAYATFHSQGTTRSFSLASHTSRLTGRHSIPSTLVNDNLELQPVTSFAQNPLSDPAACDPGLPTASGDHGVLSSSGRSAKSHLPDYLSVHSFDSQASDDGETKAGSEAKAGVNKDADYTKEAAMLAALLGPPLSVSAPGTPSPARAESAAATDRRATLMLQSTLEGAALDIPETKVYESGPILSFHRFRAMISKRFRHALRDRKAILSQILLPGLFVLAGMLVATSFPPTGDPKPLALEPSLLAQVCDGSFTRTTVPYAVGPPTTASMRAFISNLTAVAPSDVSYIDVTGSPFLSPGGSGEPFDNYIMRTYTQLERLRRAGVTVGEETDPIVTMSTNMPPGGLRAKGWYDNRHHHALPTVVSMINGATMLETLGPNYTLTAINWPLNRTLDTKIADYLKSGTDLVVAINVIIALSFVPASFVLYLVNERTSKSKHLQFVSGVTPPIYWLSTFLWDLMNYIIPAVICMIVFLAFNLPAYSGRNFGAVVSLLLLYGWSITPMMYPFSFLFSVPSTAYIMLISINLFVGLTGTLATFTLELFPEDAALTNLNNAFKWVFLVFPNYALGRGLMDLARNEYTAQFRSFVGQSGGYNDPFQFKIIGRNLMFMALEGVFFIILIVVIEYISVRVKPRKSSALALTATGEDADVIEERERVNKMVPSTTGGDVLLVKELQKFYQSKGKTKHAVRGLSFGVHPGECFGLLGVNGAGKTSTFQMLTADTAVSSGEAFLCGHSILSEQFQARQKQGYCPQFDALNDLLTGRETLTMFARIRGIPEHEIATIVNWTLHNMQLDSWADRVTRSYSGGNKRKLSVAITLIGNPPVIFLDEPTTGMDPKARRFLWNQIAAIVRAGRSVVLTSHSMEECEALCTRLAIMVDGRFRCLGSPQHLKSIYGSGYTLIVKVHDPERSQHVLDAIRAKMLGAALKEAHHVFVRLQLPVEGMPPLSQLFAHLEQLRLAGLLDDYSLSQTTLDEIFCNFARQSEHDHGPDAPPVESAAVLV